MSRGKLILRLKAKGLSHAEIAKKLGITPGGVSSQLNAQRKREGLLGKPASVASTVNSVVDVKSAIVYLRQARGKRPAYAKVLAELALLTLLGGGQMTSATAYTQLADIEGDRQLMRLEGTVLLTPRQANLVKHLIAESYLAGIRLAFDEATEILHGTK